MRLFLAALSFLPSLIVATAIPEVKPHNQTLIKRCTDVYYIADCQQPPESGSGMHFSSFVAYYYDVDNSQSGKDLPNALSKEYINPNSTNGFGFLTWEGTQQSIDFPGSSVQSGVTLDINIDSDAQTYDYTDWAGWLRRTSDDKHYQCFKDNNRDLFMRTHPVPDGLNWDIICTTRYWCTQ